MATVDTSKIIKKAVRRKTGRRLFTQNDPKPPEPETWHDVTQNIGALPSRHLATVLQLLFERIGYKVEKSTHGNIRLVEYLTQEQEDILLGNEESGESDG